MVFSSAWHCWQCSSTPAHDSSSSRCCPGPQAHLRAIWWPTAPSPLLCWKNAELQQGFPFSPSEHLSQREVEQSADSWHYHYYCSPALQQRCFSPDGCVGGTWSCGRNTLWKRALQELQKRLEAPQPGRERERRERLETTRRAEQQQRREREGEVYGPGQFWGVQLQISWMYIKTVSRYLSCKIQQMVWLWAK